MSVPKLTKEQAAIIGLYTGITCGPFSDVHEKADQLMGFPLHTHHFASKDLMDELKEKVKPEFLAICVEA